MGHISVPPTPHAEYHRDRRLPTIFVTNPLLQVNSNVLLHAGNVKTSQEVGTMLNARALPAELDELHRRSVANALHFNEGKDSVMRISRHLVNR